MRLAPVILVGIGILGLIMPQIFLDQAKGGGRWIFLLILALAGLMCYRSFYKKDL